MIKTLLRSLLLNAGALFLASHYISGFHLVYAVKSFLIITLVFTAIHLFIKPILNLILGAVNFLTFGLVSLALDVLILYALTIFFPQISFSSWLFPGFEFANVTVAAYEFSALGSTIASAIIINIVRHFGNYLVS